MGQAVMISIITPAYNAEGYIAETVNSVLKAKIDYPFEYLVLNDGSEDRTLEILESFESKIKVISHQNIGESLTVNRGLEKANGKYALVLSADDPLLTGDLINEAIAKLEMNDSIVALYPDWKVIDQFGTTTRTFILPDYSDEIMIGRCRCLPGPGTIFRRNSAIRIGGRREKWKFVGDYDFWLRLSREGRIERLPGVLAQWRSNSGSASISQRGLRMARERVAVIEDFSNEFDLPNVVKRMALGNSNYLAARLCFFDPEVPGIRLLMRSFLSRKKWPEEANVLGVVYILFSPIASKMIDMVPGLRTFILRKHARSSS
jgi:glycosyltransferase involved in cell wall biosynthesis